MPVSKLGLDNPDEIVFFALTQLVLLFGLDSICQIHAEVQCVCVCVCAQVNLHQLGRKAKFLFSVEF